MSLRNRLSGLFPVFDRESNIRGVIDGFDQELERFDESVEDVQDSLQINNAEGQSLDLIGDSYGPLGVRRDRDDEAYRQFLKTLIPAFDGRGTTDDVAIAVAAGLAVDDADVELIEDFDANEYEIILYDWSAHSSATTRELSELADPVGVERRDPVHLILDTAVVEYDVDDTQYGIGITGETAQTVYNVDDTVSETVNSSGTFGTGRFDGEGTFS